MSARCAVTTATSHAVASKPTRPAKPAKPVPASVTASVTAVACDVPLSALDQFWSEVRRLTPLTPAEEARLLHRVALGQRDHAHPAPDTAETAIRADAEVARTRLIEGYQPMILGLARRYLGRCDPTITLLDLAQEGSVGALEALASYEALDPMPSATVGAWLYPHLCWTLQRAAWRSIGGMRVPRHLAQRLRHLRDAHDTLLMTLQREPTEEEVASHLGMTLPYVRDLLAWQRQRIVSLDQLLAEGYVLDGDPLLFATSMATSIGPAQLDASDSSGEETEELVGDNNAPVMSSRLHNAMRLLSPRERAFVRLRFGFADGRARTQQEIASELGVSLVTAERLWRRACAALRAALGPTSSVPSVPLAQSA